MSDKGWIKLHRGVLDHWLYNEYRPLTKREAWENMLLWANFENKKILVKGSLIDCNRGQLLYSIETYAEKFCWSVGQVKSFFSLLKKDGMISMEGLKYTTRLSICNYDSYQECKITDSELTNNSQRTDSELTNNSQLQLKNEKNDNNEKELKENITPEKFILVSQVKIFDLVKALNENKQIEFEALKMNKGYKDYDFNEFFSKSVGQSYTNYTHVMNAFLVSKKPQNNFGKQEKPKTRAEIEYNELNNDDDFVIFRN
jgi:hypothetical protein